MFLGDGDEQERKTSRCLDSRGGGVRFPVSPLFELDGLGVSKGSRVQFPSEPVPLGIFLAATGKRAAFFCCLEKFAVLSFERRFIMGLLERVSTLIRANLNDMVDRAEDPEKMIKQVILDMENQYLQVKTQVAVSIADQHMLEKKWRENEDSGKDWMRKAEIAVDKSEDDLARAALDRYQTSQMLAQSYREQVDDQKAQVETLKGALVKLEQKLDEAKAKRDLLLARHRRSIALGKAVRAQTAIGDNSKSATFDRLKDRVHHTEAVASAEVELLTDDTVERLTRLDRDTEVDRLLADLKTRRGLPA
jgi:phage shock protein A